MKKLLLCIVLLALTACSDVPSGYRGIKVNLLGSDKGVDNQELGTGRYWIGMNEQLFIFPMFTQTQVWTKDVNEGSPKDDSMNFGTLEGLEVNTDIGITYSLDPNKVSVIFQKYRKGIDEITNTVLRSMVRDALINAASSRPIESVYGTGKAELIKTVEDTVRKNCVDIGINIEHVYWIGSLRLPPTIVQSINAKASATQMTAQREQEISQSKAEADKKIEEARGDAQSTLLIATAEAQAISIKGKAISDNPLVIQLNAIEKWNGELPTTMVPGAAVPFVNIK
jgi:regulator of protease activity HflC (stomatin/prohibitin superfamily)